MLHSSTNKYLCSFRLHTFPTKNKNPEAREIWKKLINRKPNEGEKSKFWSPGKKARVCSKHFELDDSSYPKLELGYDASAKIIQIIPFKAGVKRRLSFSSSSCSNKKTTSTTANKTTQISIGEYIKPTHKQMHNVPIQTDIQTDKTIIQNSISVQTDDNLYEHEELIELKQKIANLEKKNQQLELQNKTYKTTIKALTSVNRKMRLNIQINEKMKKSCVCKQPMHKTLINDKNIQFYTGLPTVEAFNGLLCLVEPYVQKKWKGPKLTPANLKRKYKREPVKLGRKKKLTNSDELLLTLMKLRLALAEQDLADRFGISVSNCSSTFLTWVRALALCLGPTVYTPSLRVIKATQPKRFNGIYNMHSIIDAFELFIETPKDPVCQKLTWSQYKHHNTIKILCSVLPNSSINFISKCYPGCTSDKKLTLMSGYLDHVPSNSTIMADKGFNIKDECLIRNITLYKPPGKRGANQMLPYEQRKTKRIANKRILVEQVIRQLRCFKILTHELPIKLLNCMDDVVLVCSALCNLTLSPIFRD